jgi:hypothetical protein
METEMTANVNTATLIASCRAKFGDAIKDWDDAKITRAMGRVRTESGAHTNVKLGIEGKNSHLNRPEVVVEATPTTDAPAKGKGKGKKSADPLLDALKKTA